MDYSYKYTFNRCQYTSTMAEHMRQTTRADSVLSYALHWVRICITECNMTLRTVFKFLLFLTSLHLFTAAKHYFTLLLLYGVARSLLMILCRNMISIILTPFPLDAHLVKFRFPTLGTFCWIASHILDNNNDIWWLSRNSILPSRIYQKYWINRVKYVRLAFFKIFES